MPELINKNPEIYRIDVPLTGNPLKNLNCYVIKDGGESAVIDTGFRTETPTSRETNANDTSRIGATTIPAERMHISKSSNSCSTAPRLRMDGCAWAFPGV